jgi:hypothetical protein
LIEEYVLRFVVGGLAVSAFAMFGDVFRPRSFAGLFGAAPSIAIATLVLTIWKHGSQYAAVEASSMIVGAAALCFYCVIVFRLLKCHHLAALWASLLAIAAWLAAALSIDFLIFG